MAHTTRRRRRIVAAISAIVLAALMGAAAGAPAAGAVAVSHDAVPVSRDAVPVSHGAGRAGAEVAPYVEPTSPHASAVLAAIRRHGLRRFSVGFVLGRHCAPTWDDYAPLTGTDAGSTLVARARAAGAQPIVSFGGQSGHELAAVCSTRAELVAAYARVIELLHTRSVDFDIEGAQRLNDTATNARRFSAIRTLEHRFPRLWVSVTIPVGLSGILGDRRDGDALSFLRLAKSRGARIDVVNLMTMDYGSAVPDMGAAAIHTTRRALTQLRRIWPADGYRNLGITPMIGVNESPGETFGYANAQHVVSFARAHRVGRLAFWSLNRDRACGAHDHAPDTCSGMTQHPLDFTDAFLGG